MFEAGSTRVDVVQPIDKPAALPEASRTASTLPVQATQPWGRARGRAAIDVDLVAERVRQWLYEGMDVRIVAMGPAICESPIVELWGGRMVEVVTAGGTIRERTTDGQRVTRRRR